MSDIALKNATALRDRLSDEVRSLQTAIREKIASIKNLDEWIANWHQFAQVDASPQTQIASSSGSVSSGAVTDAPTQEVERARTTGNPKKEFVARASRRIIEELGEPIARSDLFRHLNKRGIHISGRDPEQVLSTMLWRTRDEFGIVRIPSGGYWLAELPHEASGYSPVASSDADQLPPTPMGETQPSADDPDAPSPDDLRDVQFDRETDLEAERREREGIFE